MPTRFQKLCELLERLSATTGKKQMVGMVASFISSLEEGELSCACYFIVGDISARWDQRTLDVSFGTIVKVLRDVAQCQLREIFEVLKEIGDLGETTRRVLEAKKSETRPLVEPPPLTIEGVYKTFQEIMEVKGEGSRSVKEKLYRGLISRATPLEAKYIVKLTVGERRYGFGENLMEESISLAFNVPLELVRRANMVLNDIGEVAVIAKKRGTEGLRNVKLTIFHPIKPMLAETASTVKEAAESFKRGFAIEYKLDGARVQIHKKESEVRIYSRHLRDVTDSLPEVVREVRSEVRASEVVLEGEVIAVGDGGRPLPFQYLMRRFRRVKGVAEYAGRIGVRLYLFDILSVDGKVVIDEPYAKRRELLRNVAGGINLVPALINPSLEEAEAFYKRAIEQGHEGVMVKDLQAPYTPGIRGRKWLKISNTS